MSDKIYKSIIFSDDFTVEDWDSLLELIFRRYFVSDEVFLANKELLRTELINYLKFCKDDKYTYLFEWIFHQFKTAIQTDKKLTLEQISNSFYGISDTDMKWMTNNILHPELDNLAEKDKIYYYFKAIDDIIEGCFKPRFILLYKFANYNKYKSFDDISNKDFGQLINEFTKIDNEIYDLYLKDPILNISISQWRNIVAHKSFKIQNDIVTVVYGKKNIKTNTLTYKQFYDVIYWIMNMYRVLRLSEVLIDLNFIEEIVSNLGEADKIEIRFESRMMHLIHNMQIVGFEFISSEAIGKIYSLSFKKKIKEDLKSSLIHASQCLTSIACAIYDDEFVRDNYEGVMVKVYDDDLFASALIDMSSALKFANGQISQKELIEKIEFK